MRSEITGSDSVDTKVQQYAAFQMLAMDLMLTQRSGAPTVPPAFTELDRAYKAEVLRLDRELRAEVTPPSMQAAERPQQWAPIFMKLNSYNGNAAFRQLLFKRFFSPAWVASYERKKGEFEQWRASANAGPATTGGRPAAGPGTSAGAGAVTAGAAGGAAPGAPAAEPPRELRSASGVDMMVLGVPMGKPLGLPRCPQLSGQQAAGQALGALFGVGEGPKAICQAETVAAAVLGGNSIGIVLPRAKCPAWIHMTQACGMSALLHDGRLALVLLVTGGLDFDEQLDRDLREKYGKPTKVKRVTWSNPNGGRWEVEELTWDLKDLFVEYKPMGKIHTVGSLTIVTAEGRRHLEAESGRQDAKRPRL